MGRGADVATYGAKIGHVEVHIGGSVRGDDGR